MQPRAPTLIQVVALTHRGAVRDRNEDAIAIDAEVLLGDMETPRLQEFVGANHVLMVADGVGGHPHGALASRTALQTLVGMSRNCVDPLGWTGALVVANNALYDMMVQRPDVLGMGTTVVGVVFGPAHLIHFNVGDSRAYRHRPGELIRLSHDDVPSGTTGLGLKRTSHQITQSLGGCLSPTPILPHVASVPPLLPGESIILCSDGLTDMVSERDVSQTLDDVIGPGERAVELFMLALRGGGRDNISLVIARPL